MDPVIGSKKRWVILDLCDHSNVILKVGESSRVDSVLESVIQKGLRESSKMPKVGESFKVFLPYFACNLYWMSTTKI